MFEQIRKNSRKRAINKLYHKFLSYDLLSQTHRVTKDTSYENLFGVSVLTIKRLSDNHTFLVTCTQRNALFQRQFTIGELIDKYEFHSLGYLHHMSAQEVFNYIIKKKKV